VSKNLPAVPLLERYLPVIRNWDRYNSTLPVPVDVIPALRAAISPPAKPKEVGGAVLKLLGSFPTASTIADPKMFTEVMIDHLLRRYPIAVIGAAVDEAPARFKWIPSVKEMLELCDEFHRPRRELLRRLEEMEALHRSNQRREREIADRRDRIEKALAGAPKELRPGPGEFEIASDFVAQQLLCRVSPRFDRWQEALALGDPRALHLVRRGFLAAVLVKANMPPAQVLELLAEAERDIGAVVARVAELPTDPDRPTAPEVDAAVKAMLRPAFAFLFAS